MAMLVITRGYNCLIIPYIIPYMFINHGSQYQAKVMDSLIMFYNTLSCFFSEKVLAALQFILILAQKRPFRKSTFAFVLKCLASFKQLSIALGDTLLTAESSWWWICCKIVFQVVQKMININPGWINPKGLFNWEGTIKTYQVKWLLEEYPLIKKPSGWCFGTCFFPFSWECQTSSQLTIRHHFSG